MNEYQAKLVAARSERQRHIAAWRASGLTQAAYAAAQGIHATTFNGWLHAAKGALTMAASAATATANTDSATANVKASPVLTIRPVLVQSTSRSPTPARSSSSSSSTSISTLSVAHVGTSINATLPQERITLHGLGGWRLSLTDSISTDWLASLLRELDAAPKRAGKC